MTSPVLERRPEAPQALCLARGQITIKPSATERRTEPGVTTSRLIDRVDIRRVATEVILHRSSAEVGQGLVIGRLISERDHQFDRLHLKVDVLDLPARYVIYERPGPEVVVSAHALGTV